MVNKVSTSDWKCYLVIFTSSVSVNEAFRCVRTVENPHQLTALDGANILICAQTKTERFLWISQFHNRKLHNNIIPSHCHSAIPLTVDSIEWSSSPIQRYLQDTIMKLEQIAVDYTSACAIQPPREKGNKKATTPRVGRLHFQGQ